MFGENIWQWRAQSYLNTKSFNAFDDFIGKLVQYLASNKLKSRLNIEYESFYYGNNNVIISAEYFDKNYVFDTRESLNITVKDVISNQSKTFPLILKNNNYQVDLSSLPPSEYNFSVSASKEKLTSSGKFKILGIQCRTAIFKCGCNKTSNNWLLTVVVKDILSTTQKI